VTALVELRVAVPESLLRELDSLLVAEERPRAEVICEAITSYVWQRKRLVREQMKSGYEEMAEINLRVVRECQSLEHEALLHCLAVLVE
jgi:CopG family transcriptional regulator/antitoxin EndoAI